MPKLDPREEIARLLFTADNDNAPDPEQEWEIAKRHNPYYVKYVYVMADALISAGYQKSR
jgi:hypothetical protein